MATNEEEFVAKFEYLTPILASLTVAILCALILLYPPVQTTPVPVTPIPQDTPVGPYLNAIYLFSIMAVGASVVYILVKYRSLKVLDLIMGTALTLAFLLLGYVYTATIFAGSPHGAFYATTAAIAVAVIGDFIVFKLGGKISDATIIVLGGALGAFFGAFLSISTVLLLLGVLSVYDTIAVYYGPVGKIATAGLDQIRGVSFSFKEIQMGLGDLVFYSMLAGGMLLRLGMIPCLLSVAGIVLGSYLTFVMLEKLGMFPGLPFPSALGITFGLLGVFF